MKGLWKPYGAAMNVLRVSLPAVLLLCGAEARNSSPKLLSEYAPLSVSRESTFGESSLEREIHLGLQKLPYFGVFDHLAYRVDPGLVSLYGSVTNPELKWDAETVVMGIGCNYQVSNHIRFLPNSPDTNRIRVGVFGAIYGDPVLGRYAITGPAIHILVDGGYVVLEGAVVSDRDRRRAVERAKAVRGVSTVLNHLTVEGQN
jgi:osmotically-inducible protein OsmY